VESSRGRRYQRGPGGDLLNEQKVQKISLGCVPSSEETNNIDLVWAACHVLNATHGNTQISGSLSGDLKTAEELLLQASVSGENKAQAYFLLAKLYCRNYRFNESSDNVAKCADELFKFNFLRVPGFDEVIKECSKHAMRVNDRKPAYLERKPRRGKTRNLKAKLKKQQEQSSVTTEDTEQKENPTVDEDFIPYQAKDHYSEIGSNKASQDIIDQRRRLMAAFETLQENSRRKVEEELKTRIEIRGRDTDVTTEEETSVEVFEFLTKKETVPAA